MAILSDIKLGLSSYKESVKFVIKHKMWLYFIPPLILFGAIYYFGFKMEEGEIAAKKSLDDSNFSW